MHTTSLTSVRFIKYKRRRVGAPDQVIFFDNRNIRVVQKFKVIDVQLQRLWLEAGSIFGRELWKSLEDVRFESTYIKHQAFVWYIIPDLEWLERGFSRQTETHGWCLGKKPREDF